VLIPGLGAVATTFIAGVVAVRRGLAQPVGSLTQMGNIRLGKRTENRNPKIKDFVPLAGLEDLVFGGWDIYEDNVYQAALKARVLEPALLEAVRPELEALRPMKAAFDRRYVKNLDGTHVKSYYTKKTSPTNCATTCRTFKAENGSDRLVMVWCGSTEVYHEPGRGAQQPVRLRGGVAPQRPAHFAQHALRLRGPPGRACPSPTAPPTSP
jgi:myo-inositol-1-phosphate synthase